MPGDPLENFGEQQRSYELIEQHRAALLADARELWQSQPTFEVVGMIVEGDAAEAVAMRLALEQATGQALASRGFLGLMPRQFVVQLLRANTPASLEWLPPSVQEGRKMLPMVAVTKGGVRFAAVAVES